MPGKEKEVKPAPFPVRALCYPLVRSDGCPVDQVAQLPDSQMGCGSCCLSDSWECCPLLVV